MWFPYSESKNNIEEKCLYKSNMDSVCSYKNIANNDRTTNISTFNARLELSKGHKTHIMVAH